MILRSIQVENWRCFVGATEVGPFDEGLNVLHAPNGSGKSTLLDALVKALFDSHRVTGDKIQALCPWGRDLVPSVTVCFAAGGQEYRVKKQFLRDPKSSLERREDGRFIRFEDGEKADERLRSILRGVAPGKGPARPENLGLAQILWVPQGKLELSGMSADLTSGIRTALDVQVAGPGSGPLEERIEGLYLGYYAPTGKERTGKQAPEAARLRAQIADAEDRRRAAVFAHQAFEDASRAVEDLRGQRGQAQFAASGLEKALVDARRRKVEYDGVLGNRKTQQAEAEAARTAFDALRTRVTDIQSAENDDRTARRALGDLLEERPVRIAALSATEAEDARLRSALEDRRHEQEGLERDQSVVDDAAKYEQLCDEDQALRKRVEEITAALEVLASSRNSRLALVAPDGPTIKKIRKEAKSLDELRVRLDAALITLEVVAERPGSLTVLSGEPSGELTLVPGKPSRVKGSPEVALHLAGFGRVRAQGPSGSAGEIHRDLDRTETKLKSLTEAFGSDDLDKLETLADKAAELDQAVQEAQTRVDTLLTGRSLEEHRTELQRASAGVLRLRSVHKTWTKNRPDSIALRAALSEKRAKLRAQLEEAEIAADNAALALAAAQTALATLSARMEETEKSVEKIAARLESLQDDGVSRENRSRRLDTLALNARAAEAALRLAEEKVTAFHDDPSGTVIVLEKQVEAANKQATEALEQLKIKEGQVQSLADGGSYTILTRAEEEIRSLTDRLSAEELHMASIRLLRDTVRTCRQEAVAAVSAPVERAATRLFHRIAGGKLGTIEIGEEFAPLGIRPALVDASVGIEQSSGGEQEQIFLATRLALAEVLARDERQLVVLDDVLVATDTGRLARVLRVLEEAAEQLQILVLTCHPERYRGVDAARFLGLLEGERE